MNKDLQNKEKYLFFDDATMLQCNLKCTYCRSKTINLNKVGIRKLEESFVKGVQIVDDNTDYAIIKLFGYGEFTLLPRFLDLIKKYHENHISKSIQLISNGTLLNEPIVKELSEISMLNMCISLDGPVPEMNSCRTKSKKLLKKVLDNISLIIEYGIPLEINSVLTVQNTATFDKLLEYLNSLDGKVISFPFPVRPFPELDNSNLFPNSIHIEKFKSNVIGNYEIYSHVLPPKEYLNRLVEFMEKGERKWNCYVAYANIGVDQDGNLLLCACGPKKTLGNIFEKSHSTFAKKRNIKPKIRWEGCDYCFNHYELLNLYFDNLIELGSLTKIPSLNYDSVRNRLNYLKSGV